VIVVDTSVWVEATRTRGARTRETLQGLIDADEAALALPVRMELAAGLATKDRAAFMRALSALPLLVPTEDTWTLVEGWIAPAAGKGHRFAVTDLLIAGLTHEIGALVWSLDDDFARLEALGHIRRY
jgi:predicted nucleic acid-binding protein